MDKKYCSDDKHVNHAVCFNSFASYNPSRDVVGTAELTPRSMEYTKRMFDHTTEQLLSEVKCDFVALKILLTRLRRCMPTGKITYASGIDKHKQTDWLAFKTIYEKDIEYFNKRMTDRWIVAILDTYIDHGSPVESRNAMLANCFVRYERISATERYAVNNKLDKRSDFDPKKIIRNSRPTIWGDVLCTQMVEDDFYCNVFMRHRNLLQETPFIYDIYRRFVKNAMNSKKSLISVICKASPWVKEKIIKILEMDG